MANGLSWFHDKVPVTVEDKELLELSTKNEPEFDFNKNLVFVPVIAAMFDPDAPAGCVGSSGAVGGVKFPV